MKWLRWVAAGIVAVALVAVAVIFDVNVGKILKRILGANNTGSKPSTVVDDAGKEIGEESTIVKDRNPLRDKTQVNLSNGEKVDLPEGMVDSDVKRVVKVETGEYKVEKKHRNLTDVFD